MCSFGAFQSSQHKYSDVKQSLLTLRCGWMGFKCLWFGSANMLLRVRYSILKLYSFTGWLYCSTVLLCQQLSLQTHQLTSFFAPSPLRPMSLLYVTFHFSPVISAPASRRTPLKLSSSFPLFLILSVSILWT